MPVYDYKGLTPAGDAKTGIIDADSPARGADQAARAERPRHRHRRARRVGRRQSDERRRFQGAEARAVQLQARAEGPQGGPDLHAAARDAAQGRHPARAGDLRPDRAVPDAGPRGRVPRHPREDHAGPRLRRGARVPPGLLRRPVRQHGQGRRGGRQPRRRAQPPRRLPPAPGPDPQQGRRRRSPTRSSCS